MWAAAEREQIDARMERMMRYLNSLKGQKVTIGEGYKEYFYLETYKEDGTFLFARERADVIERERPFSCVECQCSISMDFEKVDFSVRYCCGVFSVYFLKTVWKWDWLEKHR